MIDIHIVSQAAIQSYTSDKKHIVISVRDSWEPSFPLPNNQNRLDALRLQFDDINKPHKGFAKQPGPAGEILDLANLVLFDVDMAKRIKEFVLKYQDIEEIWINCYMGISRSAAIAKSLNQWKPDVYESGLRFRHNPNTLVNAILLDELQKAT